MRHAFAAIVLAAGASSRMARPKALLPVREGGPSFLEEAALALVTAKPMCSVAVVSPLVEAHGVPAAFSAHVVNPRPESGQLASVCMGLRRLLAEGEFAGTLIMPVDNPGRLAERIAILLSAVVSEPTRVIAASHGDEPGHPLWLPRRLWDGVLAWNGPEGLRGFLMAHGEAPKYVEAGREALHDIDTPEDYRKLTAP